MKISEIIEKNWPRITIERIIESELRGEIEINSGNIDLDGIRKLLELEISTQDALKVNPECQNPECQKESAEKTGMILDRDSTQRDALNTSAYAFPSSVGVHMNPVINPKSFSLDRVNKVYKNALEDMTKESFNPLVEILAQISSYLERSSSIDSQKPRLAEMLVKGYESLFDKLRILGLSYTKHSETDHNKRQKGGAYLEKILELKDHALKSCSYILDSNSRALSEAKINFNIAEVHYSKNTKDDGRKALSLYETVIAYFEINKSEDSETQKKYAIALYRAAQLLNNEGMSSQSLKYVETALQEFNILFQNSRIDGEKRYLEMRINDCRKLYAKLSK